MREIIEMLKNAIEKQELKKFLTGQEQYNIPSREGFFTDISAALYAGIYEYYKINPQSNINIIFEKELINMLQGKPFEIMCAFDYCWRHISCEERKTAPFKLSDECLIQLKNSIINNKEILKTYKEYFEFGSNLENGAYQYAQNIDKSLETDYGRKIL